MRYLLALLVLPFWASSTCSQTVFAPAGATWEYHYIEGWTLDTGTLRVAYVGDTILYGKNCKRLCATKQPNPFFPANCPDSGELQFFLVQSNDSVLISSGFSPFLYSFKLNYIVGDTVAFPLLYGLRKFAVIKVDTLHLNNQSVRRFNLYHKLPATPEGSLATNVYDLFGPELGFFSSWWGIAVDGDSYFLCSYKDDGFPKIYLSGVHCTGMVGLDPSVENSRKLVLSPNPTADFLQLDFAGPEIASPLEVDMYNALGRLVLRDNVPAMQGTIDLRQLQSGLYWVVVHAEGLAFRQKIVKY